jgi:hypothetical protein
MKPAPQATLAVSQVPVALQVWVTRALPAQVAAPQVVPAGSRRQPPLPSQPLEQASSRQVPLGSAPPTFTFEQVPSRPGRAQDRQVRLQAVSQHRPCAQMLLQHSAARLQMAPLGAVPQSPALQTLGARHCESVPQVPRQALPMQPCRARRSGRRAPCRRRRAGAGAGLGVLAGVAGWGPCRRCRRGTSDTRPWPSQRPSEPQLRGPSSRQTLAGSFSPRAARWSMVLALTGTHLPRLSGLAQKVHLPVQAFSQQTPSTQKPVPHWLFWVQSWPGPFLPQLPALAGVRRHALGRR